MGKNLKRDKLKFSHTFRQWFPSVKCPVLVPVLPASDTLLTVQIVIFYLASTPDTALIEKESVKHFALANSQPQVIHVQVLHIKEMERREAQAGGGEEIYNGLVDWP